MEQRCAAAELQQQELPGFRFHPTEEELLEFYLKQVAGHGKKLKFDIIPTVHLYRHDPWDLPALATVGEREWYFFVPRDVTRKQHQQGGGGGRPSRTTERGFWKATGSDRAVRCAADPRRLVGLKKTLVYYEGRAPRGTKTDWVMNEYRLPDSNGGGKTAAEDVVLCKVYRKAVSLKELEQRVAMDELARSAAASTTTTASTPSSHSAGSPAISSASTDVYVAQQYLHHHHHAGAPPCPTTMMSMKEEEEAVPPVAVRTMRPPQLEVAKGLEWLQDPFLTQLRSPWMMESSLSPYYASSVLNF